MIFVIVSADCHNHANYMWPNFALAPPIPERSLLKMEHTTVSELTDHAAIAIPHLCSKPWDNSSFLTYMVREGWSEAQLIGQDAHCKRSETEVLDFLQTWLFFGLLRESFGPKGSPGYFVRPLAEGGFTVSTENLRAIWREEKKRWAEEPREENQPAMSVARMPSLMLKTVKPDMGWRKLSPAIMWPATSGRNSASWLVQRRPTARLSSSAPTRVMRPRASMWKGAQPRSQDVAPIVVTLLFFYGNLVRTAFG